jgi:hypothetical protein
MQSVNTFLICQGINADKPVLKEMSYPPKIVIPYPSRTACDKERHTWLGPRLAWATEKEDSLWPNFVSSCLRSCGTATSPRGAQLKRSVGGGDAFLRA